MAGSLGWGRQVLLILGSSTGVTYVLNNNDGSLSGLLELSNSISDTLKGISLQKVGQQGSSERDNSVDQLSDQVDRLSDEVRKLLSSRGVTVVHSTNGRSGGGFVTYVVLPLTICFGTWAYMKWHGYNLEDLLYVSRASLKHALGGVSKNVTQIKEQISSRIEEVKVRLEGKIRETLQLQEKTQEEVESVSRAVARVEGSIEEQGLRLEHKLQEQSLQAHRLENKLDDQALRLENQGLRLENQGVELRDKFMELEGKLDYTATGIGLLCNVVCDVLQQTNPNALRSEQLRSFVSELPSSGPSNVARLQSDPTPGLQAISGGETDISPASSLTSADSSASQSISVKSPTTGVLAACAAQGRNRGAKVVDQPQD
ncbi:hypothetical protein CYMTET_12458 [Cymbomonas tetramitiformis]|uniref:DUF1664 domain-containing protein n=1 Tax=Cymbomonas tetramitiformis TaxID=36881 RepID=A0AAE0GKA4_9CHLO|nr:hypothetical protein CYMTET_12458 [Cymbomonas tetramitiformis]